MAVFWLIMFLIVESMVLISVVWSIRRQDEVNFAVALFIQLFLIMFGIGFSLVPILGDSEILRASYTKDTSYMIPMPLAGIVGYVRIIGVNYK
ncbi:hypothetical protein [Limosilactobacillus fermentum]|uniref:hypothetical protein n=1 Tax=Limosilactobacillus fermentum TaxID=1613 RepID=UPI003004F129